MKRLMRAVKMTLTASRGQRKSLHSEFVPLAKLKERGKLESKARLSIPFRFVEGNESCVPTSLTTPHPPFEFDTKPEWIAEAQIKLSPR